MRTSGPFSQYNRYVIRYGLHGDGKLGGESLLAGFAAQEARLLREFGIWAGLVPDTLKTYAAPTAFIDQIPDGFYVDGAKYIRSLTKARAKESVK